MNTPDLPRIYSGKVRDIYDAGENKLLMVARDTISAFDVVMNETMPNKGRVLTAMSSFWFDQFSDAVGSHLISTDIADFPQEAQLEDLAGRSMLCHRVEMLPIECIVRGYITGSAWKEYKKSGTMHGTKLPEGLIESDRLPETVFTPSTKADEGHDENISFEESVNLIGSELANKARDLSIELYELGAARAADAGIIIADTKFEMGLLDGELVLADEVLTPDSSRFWAADEWQPGSTPPSFDKQPIRDYLDGIDWDKTPPPPPLPQEVIDTSAERYVEGYERITAKKLADWPGA